MEDVCNFRSFNTLWPGYLITESWITRRKPPLLMMVVNERLHHLLLVCNYWELHHPQTCPSSTSLYGCDTHLCGVNYIISNEPGCNRNIIKNSYTCRHVYLMPIVCTNESFSDNTFVTYSTEWHNIMHEIVYS